MAVNDTPRRAGPFTGNGTTTVFPFDFKALAEGDLRVATRAPAGLFFSDVDPADYTVSGVGDDSGGSITLATSLADQHELVILSAASYDQPLTLFNQGPYFAEDVMRALDRGVVLTQQLKEQVDRSVKTPEDETSGAELVSDLLGARDEAAQSAVAAGMLSDAASISAVQAEAAAALASAYPVPLGQMVVLPSVVALPDGYIEAGGASLNRNDWPKLFVKIGTAFGEGAGPAATQRFSNPDFSSGLTGWDATFGSGSVVGGRFEVIEQEVLMQPLEVAVPAIVTVDVHANPGAFVRVIAFSDEPDAGPGFTSPLFTSTGLFKVVVPTGFNRFGIWVAGDFGVNPVSINSVTLHTGGTFAAPNPTAPVAETRWIIRAV